MLISYCDRDRRYQYNNAAYTRWFGTSQGALRGRTMPEVLGTEAYEQIRGYVDAVLGGRAVTFETTIAYQNAGVRREALGRLAGGIAHDFNNLLQTIINCCATALLSLNEESSPVAQAILHMKRSAERGSTMTRQLLAFSHDRALSPSRIDLDAVLLDMEFLLKRLIGSNVEVEFDRRANCRVLADAGQLQQVIMNLAINAGDAMPQGGTLRIETRVIELTPEDARVHPTLRAGRYARITVSDTGTGMDRVTLERAFEPFFTMKPPERGSGLGLAMVYGIIQKLGGLIEVDSELNQGTTFRIYLPRVEH